MQILICTVATHRNTAISRPLFWKINATQSKVSAKDTYRLKLVISVVYVVDRRFHFLVMLHCDTRESFQEYTERSRQTTAAEGMHYAIDNNFNKQIKKRYFFKENVLQNYCDQIQ